MYANQPYQTQPIQTPMQSYQNPYLNNNGYSGYMPPHQRLQALEQQFPQYGQTIPVQTQPIQQEPIQQNTPVVANNQIVTIIVRSEDEARKYMPDMSGEIQTFVQKDNNNILRYFTKQINDNLDVEFNVYEKVQKKVEDIENQVVEDEKPDLLITIQNNIQSLESKMDNLQEAQQKLYDAINS